VLWQIDSLAQGEPHFGSFAKAWTLKAYFWCCSLPSHFCKQDSLNKKKSAAITKHSQQHEERYMNLEWKAVGVVWHAWYELRPITDVMCFGKLIHLHILSRICFTIQFLGRGIFSPFLTQILHTITLISKVTQTIIQLHNP
jgi:hypothetical protein